MKADIPNLEDSKSLNENLTELRKEEKDKLPKLILARLSVIKQGKKNLISISKNVIQEIEEFFNSKIQKMDLLIDSLFKLMSKDKYNDDELFTINNIFTFKLFLKPRLCSISPTTLIDRFELLKKFTDVNFDCVPIFSNDIVKKLNDYKKLNIEKISLVLRSQDKSFYVTGGKDGVVRTWDNKGSVKDAFYYKQNKITALALSADTNHIVSGSRDGKVILIDLESPDKSFGNYFSGISYNKINPVLSVSISVKNQYIIFSTSENFFIIDIKSKFFNYLDNNWCIIRQIGNKEYVL